MDNIGSLEADLFMELLEFLTANVQAEPGSEGAKHLQAVTAALGVYSDDESAVQEIVLVCRVLRAYGGRKKPTIALKQEHSPLLVPALKLRLSNSGAAVRSGRPPPSPVERVLQSVLNGEVQAGAQGPAGRRVRGKKQGAAEKEAKIR